MRQKTLWTGSAFGLALLLVVLASACSREAMELPSGTSALPSSTETGILAAQASSGPGGDNDNDNDDTDNDNDNDNAAGNENRGPGNEEGERLRGLLFEIVDGSGGIFTLVMKRGRAVVDDDTRLEREVGGVEESLTLAEFRALLRPGLPLRVTLRRGAGGTAFAARARIDDEIQATGVVNVGRDVVRATGEFMLTVTGVSNPILFRLAPNAELDPFEAGDQVRVEGIVPFDLNAPFEATEIEFDN